MSNITYHGFASFQGPDGLLTNVVYIVDGDAPQGELPGGPFAWGKGQDDQKANPAHRANVMTRGRALALALCTHLLEGREDMARVVMTRFQHRIVTNLTTGQDFMLRRSELLETLKQIVESATDNEDIARKVALERPPVAMEGGIGPGGTPLSEIEKRSAGGQPGTPASKLREEDL